MATSRNNKVKPLKTELENSIITCNWFQFDKLLKQLAQKFEMDKDTQGFNYTINRDGNNLLQLILFHKHTAIEKNLKIEKISQEQAAANALNPKYKTFNEMFLALLPYCNENTIHKALEIAINNVDYPNIASILSFADRDKTLGILSTPKARIKLLCYATAQRSTLQLSYLLGHEFFESCIQKDLQQIQDGEDTPLTYIDRLDTDNASKKVKLKDLVNNNNYYWSDKDHYIAIKFAIEYGASDVFDQLYLLKPVFSWSDNEYYTTFKLAIEHGEAAVFHQLYLRKPVFKNPLHLKNLFVICTENIKMGGKQFALKLVDLITDPRDPIYSGTLSCAVQMEDSRLFKKLLSVGVTLGEDSHNKVTPLIMAYQRKLKDFDDVLELEFNCISETFPTPFHRAIHFGTLDLLYKFLGLNRRFAIESKRIHDINTKNAKGQTVLHLASQLGAHSMIYTKFLLVEPEIDVNALDSEGNTAFMCAIQTKNIDAAILILKDKRHVPPTHINIPIYAISHDFPAKDLASLAEAGFDLCYKDKNQENCLHIAIRLKNHLAIAEFHNMGYTKNPSFINATNIDGDTPLHLIVKENDLKSLNLILKGVPDLFLTNVDGLNPLHIAVKNANFMLALQLIKHQPAILKSKDNDGNTPLHLALLHYDSKKEPMGYIIRNILTCDNLLELLEIENEQGVAPKVILLKNEQLTSLLKTINAKAFEAITNNKPKMHAPQIEVVPQVKLKEEKAKEETNTGTSKATKKKKRAAHALPVITLPVTTESPLKKEESTFYWDLNEYNGSIKEQASETNASPASSEAHILDNIFTNPVNDKNHQLWRKRISKLIEDAPNHDLEHIVSFPWKEWGVRPTLNLHGHLPSILQLIRPLLPSNQNSDDHHGVYAVGSSVVQAMLFNKVDMKVGDIDLVVVGVDINHIMSCLKAAGFVYEDKTFTGYNIITIEFPDEGEKSVDIVCISNNEFDANLKGRDYTITSIAFELIQKNIVCQIKALVDIHNSLVCLQQAPETSFTTDFTRKIRGIRLMYKLEQSTMHLDEKTKTAILDESTNFYSQTSNNLDPNEHVRRLVRLRNQVGKLVGTCGFSKSSELLQQFNLQTQIALKIADRKLLLRQNLHYPYKLQNTLGHAYYTNYLLPLLNSLQDFEGSISDWESGQYYEGVSNKSLLVSLLRSLEQGKQFSLYYTMANRLLCCLIIAGVDMRHYVQDRKPDYPKQQAQNPERYSPRLFAVQSETKQNEVKAPSPVPSSVDPILNDPSILIAMKQVKPVEESFNDPSIVAAIRKIGPERAPNVPTHDTAQTTPDLAEKKEPKMLGKPI